MTDKSARQQEAITKASERVLRRAYSLSVSLMRAKGAYEAYHAAMTTLFLAWPVVLYFETKHPRPKGF